MLKNEIIKRPDTDNISDETHSSTALSGEQKQSLVTAMKIAYYRDFFRRGIITAEQLEQLLAMQKEYTADNKNPAA